MYGANSTIARLWYNQSAALLGNLLGGAIFVGLAAHLMNHWKSPFFQVEGGGTLLGHDAESTRRARDVRKNYDDLEAGIVEVQSREDLRNARNGELTQGDVEERRTGSL